MPRAPSVSRLRKVSLLALPLVSVLFGACAHITDDELSVALKGPRKKPLPIVTHFSKALQCMDQKLLEYGVWDKKLLITDIIDNTQAVPVGASDMLITALAQMGKRSGAVTIIPNSGPNLVELLKDNPPDYYIRGSITQYDRDFLVEESGVGFSWAEYLGLGYGEGERVSAVGVDLTWQV